MTVRCRTGSSGACGRGALWRSKRWSIPLADVDGLQVRWGPEKYNLTNRRWTTDGHLESRLSLCRENHLFVGSQGGGKSAAIAYILIETAKLNGADPQHWLTDVLARIAIVVTLPDFKDRYFVWQMTDMYAHNFKNVGSDLLNKPRISSPSVARPGTSSLINPGRSCQSVAGNGPMGSD